MAKVSLFRRIPGLASPQFIFILLTAIYAVIDGVLKPEMEVFFREDGPENSGLHRWIAASSPSEFSWIFYLVSHSLLALGACAGFRSGWSGLRPLITAGATITLACVSLTLFGEQIFPLVGWLLLLLLGWGIGSWNPGWTQWVGDDAQAAYTGTTDRNFAFLAWEVLGLENFETSSSPAVTQYALESYLSLLEREIQAYGGKILACYGNRGVAAFRLPQKTVTNADQALLCASKLVGDFLKQGQLAASHGQPVLVPKIGISLGRCWVVRSSHNLVGDGPLQAEHLRTSCPPFMINFSEDIMLQSGAYTQWDDQIKLKTFPGPSPRHPTLQAFELNALQMEESTVQEVLREYRRHQRLLRESDRIWLKDSQAIEIYTRYGPATLIDFSHSGMSLVMDTYLAEGIDLHLEFDSPDGFLRKALTRENLHPITARVVWGRAFQRSFKHGIQFSNLNESQRLALFELLRGYAVIPTQASA